MADFILTRTEAEHNPAEVTLATMIGDLPTYTTKALADAALGAGELYVNTGSGAIAVAV